MLGERHNEEMRRRNKINMLEILNPYLKRMVSCRQGLVDSWNKTLKFDSLEIAYSHVKADFLSILFLFLA